MDPKILVMDRRIVLLTAYVTVLAFARTSSAFPSQNTPPVFDFNRDLSVPEDEAVGE